MTTTTSATPSLSPALAAAEEALIATAGVAVERGVVTVDGVRLHYLTCGQGEPLLLQHGRGDAGAHRGRLAGWLRRSRDQRG